MVVMFGPQRAWGSGAVLRPRTLTPPKPGINVIGPLLVGPGGRMIAGLAGAWCSPWSPVLFEDNMTNRGVHRPGRHDLRQVDSWGLSAGDAVRFPDALGSRLQFYL